MNIKGQAGESFGGDATGEVPEALGRRGDRVEMRKGLHLSACSTDGLCLRRRTETTMKK